MEKFIPVVVIKELVETDKILTALKNNGINCAEITFRTACAAEAIAYASKNYPDMQIGAGTVINAEQCKAALEAGATDFMADGDIFEIHTETSDLSAVKEALEAAGYTIASAEEDKIPSTYVELTDEDDIKKMNLLISVLEDHDDVQNVYHNWENADE